MISPTEINVNAIVSFFLCIVVAASYIPQLIKSWKSKKTSDLSYNFLIIQSLEDLIVCIYAWINSDTILFFGGIFSLSLIYSLLIYKLSLDGFNSKIQFIYIYYRSLVKEGCLSIPTLPSYPNSGARKCEHGGLGGRRKAHAAPIILSTDP